MLTQFYVAKTDKNRNNLGLQQISYSNLCIPFGFKLKPFSSRLVSTGELCLPSLESTTTSHNLCCYQGSTFKSNKICGNSCLSVTVWYAELRNKLNLNFCWIFSLIIWILFRGVFRAQSNICDIYFYVHLTQVIESWILPASDERKIAPRRAHFQLKSILLIKAVS